jgi:hypothetical protein
MEGSIGEQIKAWVFGIIGLGLVAFFIWPIFEQMRGEVTVYNMFCKTQRIQGQCKADEEQTANPESFKVYPDQQSVIYWIGDSAPTVDDEPSSTLPNPGPLWPPPQMAMASLLSRPKFTAAITSATSMQRAINGGRLSILAL